jgi:hypothetical protein
MRTLKRLSVLVVLIFACMVVQGRSKARVVYSDCTDNCAANRDGCVSDVDAWYFICNMNAGPQLDFCYEDAAQAEDQCNAKCGATSAYLQPTCYSDCRDEANSQANACESEYNAALSACSSDQSNGHENCAENYDWCVQHCNDQ